MPRKKKLDKETEKVYEKNGKLFDLTQHPGWGEAKNVLFSMIKEMDKLSSLVTKDENGFKKLIEEDPIKLNIQVMARISATSIIEEWLSQLEGASLQYREFLEQEQKENNEDEVIMRI